MNVFVLNCGSSSVKFQVINTDLELFDVDGDRTLVKGQIERLGHRDSIINFQVVGYEPFKAVQPVENCREAITRMKDWMESPKTKIPGILGWHDIHAIAHRVVHGGEKFTKSVLIDKKVISQIEECSDLAPLHNPANLKGIAGCYEIFGDKIPQVAVFDTSFHSTVSKEVFLCAIPYEFYEKYSIRRYGFHGTSHRYLAYRYRQLTGKNREDVNIITMHLGNGCSACAIRNGYSVDTSMGMTPLQGLIMGTRSGDIDPTILLYLCQKGIGSLPKIFDILNKKSGLAGISGISGDMREIEKAASEGHERARLAMKMFATRAKKYVGYYMAGLNNCGAVVFSAGIGENSPTIRSMICANMDGLGILIDEELNKKAVGGRSMKISRPESKVEVWVIHTDEELLMARDAVRVVRNVERTW